MIRQTFGKLLNFLNLIPMQSITATGAITGVDCGGITSQLVAFIAALNTAGTNPTLDVKLQHSNDNGSTDAYADISPAVAITQITTAGAKLVKLTVESPDIKRWVRAFVTIGGTASPAYTVSAVIAGIDQVETEH